MHPRLILVLGDQLSPHISALQSANREHDVVLMAEVDAEASYVKHHKKKLAFVFSAMRHFAEELRRSGWRVDYVQLDDPDNSGTLESEVQRAQVRLGRAPLHAAGHSFGALIAMTWDDPAIVSVIGLSDLTNRGAMAAGNTREPFLFYGAVALIEKRVTFWHPSQRN